MEPKEPPYDSAALEVLKPRAKKALRQRYRGMRAALPAPAAAARSAAIMARVLALPAWQAARRVALFSSLPDEVATADLVADARARSVEVSLPVVLAGDDHLTFRAAYTPAGDYPLAPGVWGILEPAEGAPVVAPDALDFVLVPALAVDPRGHRLGYGRGYYDRTLPRATRAVRVAVAFDFQLIAEVPASDHDTPVDWIVTDRRVLRATPEGGGGAPGDP